MPPASGNKGTSKKNAATVNMQKQSRNTTPAPAPSSALPPQDTYDPDFLNTRVIIFPALNFEDIVDQGASNAPVPESRSVNAMLDKLKSLSEIMEKRSTFYDRGMRFLADERKSRPDDYGDAEPKKSKHKRKKGVVQDGKLAPYWYARRSKKLTIFLHREIITSTRPEAQVNRRKRICQLLTLARRWRITIGHGRR